MALGIDAFVPVLHLQDVGVGALVGLAVWLSMKAWWGQSFSISRRPGLIVLRGLVVIALLAMLLNPVRLEESAGARNKADVFFLVDGSESMNVGDGRTRWQTALDWAYSGARDGLGTVANVSQFRFGVRLLAMESSAEPPPTTTPLATTVSSKSKGTAATESDTQLAGALRQLTSRFGRTPPAAVVVFSDGRARDAAELPLVGKHFADLKIPVHVVPLGENGKGGDLALIGIVSPPRVRKNSRIEVQAFVRSYGYDEERAVLTVSSVDGGGQRRILSSLPVSVKTGIQSFTTSYQSGETGQRIEVEISPLSTELSVDNNRVAVDVAVDRTKIRVLYIEGGPQSEAVLTNFSVAGVAAVSRGPHSDLREALAEDADLECIVLAAPPGSRRMTRVSDQPGGNTSLGFPETSAELAAFDVILLSNVTRRTISDKQLARIEEWVDKRGGGLAMLGGPNSFAAGGWKIDRFSKLLPVHLGDRTREWEPKSGIKLVPSSASLNHPVWHLVSDEARNRQLVQSWPKTSGLNGGMKLKPEADAIVLATTGPDAGNEPGIVVGRYGNGRTMVMAVPATPPWATEMVTNWRSGNNSLYGKFWRNVAYWLSEDSSIGRRRLTVSANQPFYRPGEKVQLEATAYNESASRTSEYRVIAMLEPQGALGDGDSGYSPVKWPDGISRTSGESGPYIAWGEEFELPRNAAQKSYGLPMILGPAPAAASSTQAVRVELTAYEDFTQVDSTSFDLRIVNDPYELQNPFPDHPPLIQLAEATGGAILENPAAIRAMLAELPVPPRNSVVKTSPWWSQSWILAARVGAMSVEWFWRRRLGLA